MFERFKERSLGLERLDTGDYTPAEYRRWHREMWFVHRFFGELRALRNTLFREIALDAADRLAILDVGAGDGQILDEIKKWAPGKEILFVGLELNADAAGAIRRKGIDSLVADALKLPFGDESFDHAYCTLFLHHLTDDDAVSLIREMARVASKRVFVVDLNRHPTAYYTYMLLGSLFLQRFTRDDGALSILRSRTPQELCRIAESAGLEAIKVEHSRVNRLVLSGRRPRGA